MDKVKKELLIKDLCARLPYGVKCKDTNINVVGTLSQIGLHYDMCVLDKDNGDSESCYIPNCKPYLYPISSMTEEQKEEYCSLQQKVIYNSKGPINSDVMEYVNWCYKNHIDINNLIPMGLALDATGKDIYEK